MATPFRSSPCKAVSLPHPFHGHQRKSLWAFCVACRDLQIAILCANVIKIILIYTHTHGRAEEFQKRKRSMEWASENIDITLEINFWLFAEDDTKNHQQIVSACIHLLILFAMF